MNETETARILGQIEGNLTGINREIRDIKDLLKCQSRDCEVCKGQITGRIEDNELKINALAAIQSGESAVKSWADSTLGKLGIIGGLILGVIGFVKGLT